VLGDSGRTAGIGQIHGALYSAYRRTHAYSVTDSRRAFRDTTSGINGNRRDRGTDPSVYAHVGYDTITGLGSPLWSALKGYLLNTSRPVAKAAIYRGKEGSKEWRTVTVRWYGGQGADPIRLGPSQIAVYRLGSRTPVWKTVSWARTGGHTLVGAPGATYEVHVLARDIGLRYSPMASASISVPVDDTWFAKSKTGWQRVAGGNYDVARSHLRSTKKYAQLTVGRTGRQYSLRVRTGPTSGNVGVALNGKRVATIHLYSKRYGLATRTFYTSSTRAYRKFRFTALGPRSDSVDALYVGW
jgi:hypothetical protein